MIPQARRQQLRDLYSIVVDPFGRVRGSLELAAIALGELTDPEEREYLRELARVHGAGPFVRTDVADPQLEAPRCADELGFNSGRCCLLPRGHVGPHRG